MERKLGTQNADKRVLASRSEDITIQPNGPVRSDGYKYQGTGSPCKPFQIISTEIRHLGVIFATDQGFDIVFLPKSAGFARHWRYFREISYKPTGRQIDFAHR